MLDLIGTVKGAAAITGICAGGIVSGMVADVIGNETPITLGGAIAVTATVVGGAWYLSSRLTRIDDRLDDIEKNLTRLPCGDNQNECDIKYRS